MKKFTTFLLGFLICLNISLACINDMSSIHFEQQAFPEEEDLISGKFHIHSREFHDWRIKDRLNKLEKDPDNPALLDDLAVSYEKTGQTQLAIDTLRAVLHKYPNRYETLANLGTFYIHHQEHHKGLELLQKAIKINPQAHYGREIYQIKVVEYIISLNKKPPFAFPLQKDKDFADFLLTNISKPEQKDELIRAIVGVSGMLKFGNSDSPILLEVLGDLYLRIYNDYVFPKQTIVPKDSQNKLKKYAISFYTAAYLRAGNTFAGIKVPTENEASTIDKVSVEQSIKENKQQEYLKYKVLIDLLKKKKLEPDFGYEYLLYNVDRDIKESEQYKKKLYEQEIHLMNQISDPEIIIYKKLFPKSEVQKDLFKMKKEMLEKQINYNKQIELKDNIDTISWDIVAIGVYSIYLNILISLITINFLYLKYRKKEISQYERSNLLSGAIFFTTVFLLCLIMLFNPIRFAYNAPFYADEIMAGVVVYMVIYILGFFKIKLSNNIIVKLLKKYYILNLVILLICGIWVCLFFNPSISFLLLYKTQMILFSIFPS